MSLTHVPNGRDLGGIACGTGNLRHGILYRGAAPTDSLAADELDAFGVRLTIDLRTPVERDQQPAQLPSGSQTLNADLLADASYSGAANLGRLAAEALGAHHIAEGFAHRNLRGLMIDSYRDFVSLPSARRGLGDALRRLAQPECPPALVHCTAGKDRTGWLVAVILQILGARWSDIEDDYLASGPEVRKMFATYEQRVPDAEAMARALEPVLGVFPEYLQAAQEEAETIYGSFADYVSKGLQVGDETLADLQSRLLQSRSAKAFS